MYSSVCTCLSVRRMIGRAFIYVSAQILILHLILISVLRTRHHKQDAGYDQ